MQDCRSNLPLNAISDRRSFADFLTDRNAETTGVASIVANDSQQQMATPMPFTLLINSLEILPMF